MVSFNRVFKNILTIFIGDIFVKSCGMITAIMLARYLGPEEYGKYSLILALSFIFIVLSDFGLNDLTTRDVAKDNNLASQYLSSNLISKSIISCLCMVFFVLLVYFAGYSNEMVLYAIVFSVSILCISQTNSITSIFKALERMEFVLLISFASSTALIAFVFTMVYFKESLTMIFLFRVLALFVGLAIGYIILIRKIINFKFSFEFTFVKRLLTQAFPFLTIGIIHTLYFQVDIIMLSKLKGDIYVGWFATAANDLFFGLFIIPAAISTVFYPIFSRHYAESALRLRNSCNFIVKILIVIGVAISAGTFMLAPALVHIIFGSAYDNSIIVLKIISFAICFAFARDPFGFGLAAIGKVKTLMWLNACMLILNIILNFILISLYAHIGAAISTLTCFFISFILGSHYLNKEIKHIVIVRNFIKPIISAIIMGLFIYMFKGHNLFLLIGGGAILYGVLIYILKTFTREELQILKSVYVVAS